MTTVFLFFKKKKLKNMVSAGEVLAFLGFFQVMHLVLFVGRESWNHRPGRLVRRLWGTWAGAPFQWVVRVFWGERDEEPRPWEGQGRPGREVELERREAAVLEREVRVAMREQNASGRALDQEAERERLNTAERLLRERERRVEEREQELGDGRTALAVGRAALEERERRVAVRETRLAAPATPAQLSGAPLRRRGRSGTD